MAKYKARFHLFIYCFFLRFGFKIDGRILNPRSDKMQSVRVTSGDTFETYDIIRYDN